MNRTGLHQKHGRWYLVRRNKWHPLSRVEEGDRALREALANVEAPETPTTVGELLAAYLQQGTGELAPVTVKEYRRIVASRSACVLRPETNPYFAICCQYVVSPRLKPPASSTSRHKRATIAGSRSTKSNTKRSKFEALEISIDGLEVCAVSRPERTR